MPDGEVDGGRRSPGALVGGVTALATVATVAVIALPFVGFAYRAPALHVALETVNAVIALLVGYLVYGRFAQSRRLQELLLLLAMYTVAIANLVLTALPSALTIGSGVEFSRWAALITRLLGTLLLAGAALAWPAVRVQRPRARLVVLGVTALVLGVSLALFVLGDRLPPTVDPALELAESTAPRLVAHPFVLAVHGASAVLYAASAVAFTAQARLRRDELLRWVAAGCVLGAFARVHYLLFPSLYSDYVYTGDVFRLGFYLFILVGAAREIGSYWRLRTRAAVLEDRRRTARDLHDGLSQELAYIAAQSKLLVARPGDVGIAERIGAAAGRAQDEARRAVRAMTRPQDLPFSDVLQQAVDDLAQRYDIKVVTDLDPGMHLGPTQAEGVLRIVGEAVRNAVRHGDAQRIDVQLTAEPRCLTMTDDGRGFAAGTPTGLRADGFGITSMRERAASLGAEFSITSMPGTGTTVQVSWR